MSTKSDVADTKEDFGKGKAPKGNIFCEYFSWA